MGSFQSYISRCDYKHETDFEMSDKNVKILYGNDSVGFLRPYKDGRDEDLFYTLVIIQQKRYCMIDLQRSFTTFNKKDNIPSPIISDLCNWWKNHRYECDPHNPCHFFDIETNINCHIDTYRQYIDHTLLALVCYRGSKEDIDVLIKSDINYSRRLTVFYLCLPFCLLTAFVNKNYEVLLYLLEECFKPNTFNNDFIYPRFFQIDNIIPFDVLRRINRCSPDVCLSWPLCWFNEYINQNEDVYDLIDDKWLEKNKDELLSDDTHKKIVFYIFHHPETKMKDSLILKLKSYNGLNNTYKSLINLS